MKQSELNQIKELIECLMKKEVKKQLPGVINELLHQRNKDSLVVEKKEASPEENKVEAPQTSLRELFSSATPVETPAPPKNPKNYTKNPILNEILNQTTPFRGQERMAAGIPASVMSMMPPAMMNSAVAGSPDNSIPGANIPQDVSVLDIARTVPLPNAISKALTKNYSAVMKAIDAKKGKK